MLTPCFSPVLTRYILTPSSMRQHLKWEGPVLRIRFWQVLRGSTKHTPFETVSYRMLHPSLHHWLSWALLSSATP